MPGNQIPSNRPVWLAIIVLAAVIIAAASGFALYLAKATPTAALAGSRRGVRRHHDARHGHVAVPIRLTRARRHGELAVTSLMRWHNQQRPSGGYGASAPYQAAMSAW